MKKILIAIFILIVSSNVFAGNRGQSGMDCIQPQIKSGDRYNEVIFKNNCSEDVFVLWCGDLQWSKKTCGSSNKDFFYTHSGNIKPYKTKVTQIKKGGSYKYAACRGKIGFDSTGITHSRNGDGRFTCNPTGKYARNKSNNRNSNSNSYNDNSNSRNTNSYNNNSNRNNYSNSRSSSRSNYNDNYNPDPDNRKYRTNKSDDNGNSGVQGKWKVKVQKQNGRWITEKVVLKNNGSATYMTASGARYIARWKKSGTRIQVDAYRSRNDYNNWNSALMLHMYLRRGNTFSGTKVVYSNGKQFNAQGEKLY